MQLSRFMQIALVLAAMIVAGSANAQVTVVPAGTIAGSQTWCDNETDMVLDGPVDVTGRLTILPGCIVRGQPRSADVPSAPPDPGAPGSLIIQPGAFLDARGPITSPIIFTTAAVDTDGGSNGAPDQVGGGNTNVRKWVPADGAAAFYDDTPLTNPLAAIDTTGRVNSSLWGGLVLLGDAPTNCGEGDIAPPDPDDPPGNPIIGRCNIEGSVVTLTA